MPIAEAGLLGVEAGTDTPLEAALQAVVLGPQLEGRGLFLGAPLRMGLKVGAALPPSTWLFLVLGFMVTVGALW